MLRAAAITAGLPPDVGGGLLCGAADGEVPTAGWMPVAHTTRTVASASWRVRTYRSGNVRAAGKPHAARLREGTD